jgi:hypothetical protein
LLQLQAEGRTVSQGTSWSREQLDEFCKRTRQRNPLNEPAARSQTQNAKPKRHKTPALGGAIPREAKSTPRIVVGFIGYRVRPLDPDNFAGSVKDLLDGLRHAQIIPGDEPWKIRFQTEQVKVNHYKEEKTVIQVTEIFKEAENAN